MKKRIGTGIFLFFCLWAVLPFLSGGIPGLNSPQNVFASESTAEATATTTTTTTTTTVKYKNTLRTVNGKIYYYNKNGKKIKNHWKTIRGKRYHFGKTGAADTGFVTIKGKRYCFTKKGVMRTGWFTRGTKTWYFDPSTGVMQTGWKKIDRKRYYFDDNGVMAKSTWIGKRYVGADGVYDKTKKSTITKLEKKLKSAISSYGGTWSVYVKNLDTGESISINNQKMYAASLIKLYAMGAVYEKISAGKLNESSLSSTIRSMITVSSNDAFNSIIKAVGISYVNEWCKENGYTQTNEGHGLSPASNRSGTANGTGLNVTSVKDCGKFLESVYRGTCVNRSYSNKMLSLLKQQTRRSKIPAGVPSGTTVANKTGETNDYTHDAAIVYSKGADYIIVVMGAVGGNAWNASGNITNLSRITYNYFN